MAIILRQSTAVDIGIGPFLDETDGKTAETGLTIAQADVRLKKNNGAWAQVNDATSATHEENGWYEKELDATDTNTVGILIVAVHEAGALPVWETFQVVEEAVYDAYYASGAIGQFAARGEPGQAALPVSATTELKIDYMYKLARNKKDDDGTTARLYADDGTTVDQKNTVGESGGMVTIGEIVAGP